MIRNSDEINRNKRGAGKDPMQANSTPVRLATHTIKEPTIGKNVPKLIFKRHGFANDMPGETQHTLMAGD